MKQPKVVARHQEVFNRLKSSKVVATDVETSGLDWRRNHICGYVFTFGPAPQDSYYIPVRHQYSGNISAMPGPRDATSWDGSLHPWEVDTVKELSKPGRLVFGHNLAFDLKFLSRVGLQFEARFEDTIINAPLLDEYQPKFTLEYCANAAGVEAKKSSLIIEHLIKTFPELAAKPKEAMGSYWRLPGDDLIAVEYAEGDGTSTWQLRDWQMLKIAEEGLTVVHDIESRLIPVLARMTIRGIKIDEERLHWTRDYIKRRVEALMAGFPSDFNVRSPGDVEKWCRDHGNTNWPSTPKGRPSFPESWLKTHEAGQKIVAVRKLETLDSSFLAPMLETHMFKGRVHSEFNQLRGDEFGTITGRLSSSNPNLQQVSKHDKEMGKLHRAIFIPDEGRTWASVDYSQIEPRLLAFYARAKILLAGYNAHPPVDAHTAVSAAAHPDWANLDKDARKSYRDNFGKRINQTVVTGGGKGVLVGKYGMDPATVDEFWDRYHQVMPELRPFQKRAARVMRRRGYVISLLGRRARLQDLNKDYTATNRLLQCGNADLIKLKMVEIDDYLRERGRPEGIEVLNNIHDDLAFQFDEDHRPMYDEIRQIMVDFSSGPIELDIPIEAEAGEGRTWAHATYGQFDDPRDKEREAEAAGAKARSKAKKPRQDVVKPGAKR